TASSGQNGLPNPELLLTTVRLCVCYSSRSPSLTRIGWDSNPRNGCPFTRSPGVCLQPLGHLSKLLDAQTHRRVVNTQGVTVSPRAGQPMNPDRAPVRIMSVIRPPFDLEEAPVSNLPSKRDPAPPDTEPPPTWRELTERLRDLMKDFIQEGKELERDLEPRLLPALKRMKQQIEKLIAKLEERAGKKPV